MINHLTTRENQVLDLILKECTTSQIATTLSISERTVETHRKNIYLKTNTKSVVGLVKFSMTQKLKNGT